ncbi:hypothetical protein D4100_00240 [Serratia inhibens]|uniref:Pectate lyase superfamily protein domain-containing protein n=1 Tax=Serratia inhibens TaxID=2338073 RepID=A0AA93BWU1_9GAMM|nr:hypothetical protein [Serratia inhibens]RJF57273.1 hypothetical protein D4100_00240 [Serratia inhibens]
MAEVISEYTTPEFFGAKGDGITDDTNAWQAALDTELNVHGTSGKKYLITNTLLFKYGSKPQTINGNGCSFDWKKKEVGMWGQRTPNATVITYTSGKNYENFTVKGPVALDEVWEKVENCHAIEFSNGYARNLTISGFANAFKTFGNTFTSEINTDNLRNTIWSERNNNNHISNVKCGTCAGDAIVIYSKFVSCHNINVEYAGVLPAGQLATTPRGCLISTGQDTYKDECKYVNISDVQCRYHGAAGLVLVGEHINVSGVINIGSLFEGSFVKDEKKVYKGIWIKGNNISIGDTTMESVYSGVQIERGSSDISIGNVYIRGSFIASSEVILSADDSADPTQKIERVHISSIICDAYVSVGRAVLIRTDGVEIGRIYIRGIDNKSLDSAIYINGKSKFGSIEVYNPANAISEQTLIEIIGSPTIKDVLVDGLYGTAIFVTSGALPNFGRIMLFNMKNTLKPPIKIDGDGSAFMSWGPVVVSGSFTAKPTLIGTLSLASWRSPQTWQAGDPAKKAVVKYPQEATITLQA